MGGAWKGWCVAPIGVGSIIPVGVVYASLTKEYPLKESKKYLVV
jgi:hypothetical protein